MQFTSDIGDRIRDRVLEGERPLTAAASEGVAPDVFMSWTTKLPEFAYMIMKAAATAQAALERKAFEDALTDGKQAREELRIRDPHQHSEKMAIVRAEQAAREALPDAEEAKRKAERERQAKLEEWRQNAHLIEAGSKVVSIAAAKDEKEKEKEKKKKAEGDDVSH